MTQKFTEAELKIIKLICRQLTAKEIAEKLGLSFRTVESYKIQILKKTKSRNNVGITLFAVRNKLVKL